MTVNPDHGGKTFLKGKLRAPQDLFLVMGKFLTDLQNLSDDGARVTQFGLNWIPLAF